MDNNYTDTYINGEYLVFDEKLHKYSCGAQELMSVTTLISKFEIPFDPLFPSINSCKRNERIKSGILDPKLLRKYWRLKGERAAKLGTATHIFAELYILDRNTEPTNKSEEAVIKAINELEETYEIIEQEKMVFDINILIAGQIDLVLKHKITGKIYLGDWKTTADLYKSYDKLKAPYNIKNSALNRYSIQLDMYSVLNKTDPNNVLIIQIKTDGNYVIFTKDELPDTFPNTTKVIKEIIDYRHLKGKLSKDIKFANIAYIGS